MDLRRKLRCPFGQNHRLISGKLNQDREATATGAGRLEEGTGHKEKP
jgi:hypothetical protein